MDGWVDECRWWNCGRQGIYVRTRYTNHKIKSIWTLHPPFSHPITFFYSSLIHSFIKPLLGWWDITLNGKCQRKVFFFDFFSNGKLSFNCVCRSVGYTLRVLWYIRQTMVYWFMYLWNICTISLLPGGESLVVYFRSTWNSSLSEIYLTDSIRCDLHHPHWSDVILYQILTSERGSDSPIHPFNVLRLSVEEMPSILRWPAIIQSSLLLKRELLKFLLSWWTNNYKLNCAT